MRVNRILITIFLLIYTVMDMRKKEVWWPLAAGCGAASSILHLLLQDMSLPQWLAGMLPGMFLLLIGWITKEAIGYGDGLAVLTIGLATGFSACFEITCLAILFSAVWSAALLITRRAKRGDSFPFLPFLFAAEVIEFAGVWMMEASSV